MRLPPRSARAATRAPASSSLASSKGCSSGRPSAKSPERPPSTAQARSSAPSRSRSWARASDAGPGTAPRVADGGEASGGGVQPELESPGAVRGQVRAPVRVEIRHHRRALPGWGARQAVGGQVLEAAPAQVAREEQLGTEEQVDVLVGVVVLADAPAGPADAAEAGLLGRVGEGAVLAGRAVVAQEARSEVAEHDEVEVALVVVVDREHVADRTREGLEGAPARLPGEARSGVSGAGHQELERGPAPDEQVQVVVVAEVEGAQAVDPVLDEPCRLEAGLAVEGHRDAVRAAGHDVEAPVVVEVERVDPGRARELGEVAGGRQHQGQLAGARRRGPPRRRARDAAEHADVELRAVGGGHAAALELLPLGAVARRGLVVAGVASDDAQAIERGQVPGAVRVDAARGERGVQRARVPGAIEVLVRVAEHERRGDVAGQLRVDVFDVPEGARVVALPALEPAQVVAHARRVGVEREGAFEVAPGGGHVGRAQLDRSRADEVLGRRIGAVDERGDGGRRLAAVVVGEVGRGQLAGQLVRAQLIVAARALPAAAPDRPIRASAEQHRGRDPGRDQQDHNDDQARAPGASRRRMFHGQLLLLLRSGSFPVAAVRSGCQGSGARLRRAGAPRGPLHPDSIPTGNDPELDQGRVRAPKPLSRMD